MHIAHRSLFLAISRLLWAFDFNVVDGEVPDPTALTDGLFVMPKKFKISIVPRDPKKADAVKCEWANTADILDESGQWKKVPEGVFASQNTL